MFSTNSSYLYASFFGWSSEFTWPAIFHFSTNTIVRIFYYVVSLPRPSKDSQVFNDAELIKLVS
jgi:hypothetical protein